MDILDQILARKKLEKSGQVGKAIPVAQTIRYDGDYSNRIYASGIDLGFSESGNVIYVLIYDKKIDLSKVFSISFKAKSDDSYNDIFVKESFRIVNHEDAQLLFIHNEKNPTIVSVSDGVLVFQNTDAIGVYIEHINGMFGETIHPIDPKFIPGAVLPVVELSTVLSSTTTALTDAENDAMKTAFDSGLPVVIKCDFIISSVEFTNAKLVFMVATSEGVNAFRASVGNTIMQIFSSDGTSWSGLVFET